MPSENSTVANPRTLAIYYAALGIILKAPRLLGTLLRRLAVTALIVFLLLGVYYFGGIELGGSSTGTVHLSSPAVYTKERLVNDRLREQAWLTGELEKEGKYEILVSERVASRADQRELIVSSDDSSKKTAMGSTASQAEIQQPTPIVAPQIRFEAERRSRDLIRAAILDNELDDRHDIGANSLLALTLNASITAGYNTTSPARIELIVSNPSALPDLSSMHNNGICEGLKGYECAHFIDTGVITTPDDKYLKLQLDQWLDLYNKWLRYENNKLLSELSYVKKTLNSPSLDERRVRLLQPYFRHLHTEATNISDSLQDHGLDNSNTISEKDMERCDMCSIFRRSDDDSDGDSHACEAANEKTKLNKVAVSQLLERDLQTCATFINKKIKMLDREKIVDFLLPKTSEGNFGVTKETLKNTYEKATNSRLLNEYLSTLLMRLPKHCNWHQLIVTGGMVDEKSNPPFAGLDLKPDLPEILLDCIYFEIVKRYGAHALAEVSDIEQLGPIEREANENRREESDFRYTGNIDDVVLRQKGRVFTGRKERVILVVEDQIKSGNYPDREKTYESYETGCLPSHSDSEGQNLAASPRPVNSLFKNDRLGTVDPSIGELALRRVFCHLVLKRQKLQNYSKSQPDTNRTQNSSDPKIESERQDSYNFAPEPDHFAGPNSSVDIPTGLFHFIEALSTDTSAYIYSVSPDNNFEVENATNTINTSIIGNAKNQLFRSIGFNGNASAAFGSQELFQRTLKKQRVQGFVNALENTLFSSNQLSASPSVNDHLKATSSFGWIIHPSGFPRWYSRKPVLESSNEKLSALISVPAWWERISIDAKVVWMDPTTMEDVKQGSVRMNPESAGTSKKGTESEEYRGLLPEIQIPVRLGYITDALTAGQGTNPSIEQLKVMPVTLNACQSADITVEGTRLWRSSLAALGVQRSNLIQTLPNMKGIVISFSKVLPQDLQSDSHSQDTIPLKIWSSEGRVDILDAIKINIPADVKTRIDAGKSACVDDI